MAGRPIVILDTSVFIQDALSPQQNGSASQLLAIVPTVAHVVMCVQARAELIDKLTGFDWSVEDVEARYGRSSTLPSGSSRSRKDGPANQDRGCAHVGLGLIAGSASRRPSGPPHRTIRSSKDVKLRAW
jgi:hypothetical protein